MRTAFVGTLDQTLDAARSGTLPRRVVEGFRSAYDRDPGADEVETWRHSLPVVLDSVANAIPGECNVLIEYGLPFNDQRIDLLLIGGCGSRPAAHVIELKNWGESRPSSRLEHFVEAGGG